MGHPALKHDEDEITRNCEDLGLSPEDIEEVIEVQAWAYRWTYGAPRWCQWCRSQWMTHPILTWVTCITNPLGDRIAIWRFKRMSKEQFEHLQDRYLS